MVRMKKSVLGFLFSGRAKDLAGSWLKPAESAKSKFPGTEEWKAKSLISCFLQRKSNNRSGSHLYLLEKEVQSTYEPFLSMRKGLGCFWFQTIASPWAITSFLLLGL